MSFPHQPVSTSTASSRVGGVSYSENSAPQYPMKLHPPISTAASIADVFDERSQQYWQSHGGHHGVQIVPQGMSDITSGDMALENMNIDVLTTAEHSNTSKRRRIAANTESMIAGAELLRDVTDHPLAGLPVPVHAYNRGHIHVGAPPTSILTQRSIQVKHEPDVLHNQAAQGGRSFQHRDLQDVTNVLKIIEQPTERGRFRYAKEKRRTPLNGRKEGAFPVVALREEWMSQIPDGTVIYASVVTRHDDSEGIPIPHWHALEGKTGESASQRLVQGKATFSNLVVVRNERTAADRLNPNIKSAEDHQVIRIMFQIFFRDSETQTICRSHVVSQPIYGMELKIHNVSHRIIATESDTEVIFLTSKIKKQNTALKITDLHPCTEWKPPPTVDDGAGWHLDDKKRPTFLLQPLYVHHQYALVAKLPPFYISGIQERRKVDVRLVDHVQGMESNSVELEYVPQPSMLDLAVLPTPTSTTSNVGTTAGAQGTGIDKGKHGTS